MFIHAWRKDSRFSHHNERYMKAEKIQLQCRYIHAHLYVHAWRIDLKVKDTWKPLTHLLDTHGHADSWKYIQQWKLLVLSATLAYVRMYLWVSSLCIHQCQQGIIVWIISSILFFSHLQVAVDTGSFKSMVDLLQRKTSATTAYSHLLSIVYHCLLLPSKSTQKKMTWKCMFKCTYRQTGMVCC